MSHIAVDMLDRALSSEKSTPSFLRQDGVPAGWAVSRGQIAYPDAVEAMEARVQAIIEGRAGEMVWLLEHPPLYTAGVSAKPADLLQPDRFDVFASARGGQYTYHGPGQRVAYVMLDLRRRGQDVRAFVAALEGWMIGALAAFNIDGQIRPCRVGVWVERRAPGVPTREDKIGAIGVKLRRWVSFHGVSLNVEPDLSHFDGIVPCGITEHGVTSLVDLGLPVTMDEADAALKASFTRVFGEVCETEPPLSRPGSEVGPLVGSAAERTSDPKKH
jgi:lipoyl(octanoyl) transferase